MPQVITEDDARHPDVCIICALSIERAQVLYLLSDVQPLFAYNTVFYLGYFQDDSLRISVLVATIGAMGASEAASMAMVCLLRFQCRLVIMTGIAATVRDSGADLGDILVAERILSYESGKIVMEEDGKLHVKKAVQPALLSRKLDSLAKDFADNGYRFSEPAGDWKHFKPPTRVTPNIHFGTFFCGEKVVAAETKVQEFLNEDRKLKGIDMESYSILTAQRYVDGQLCMVVKSASDYADASKSDDYQSYASYTSAHFALHFATHVVNNAYLEEAGR